MYTDIDIFGRELPNGAAIEYTDEEAVKNALTLWLTSKRGDFLRNPSAGGVVDFFVFKSMNNVNKGRLVFSLKNAINNNFFPKIQLTNVDIIPNYADKYWEITVEYIDPFTGKSQTSNIYTKDLSKRETFVYEEIDYEDENLENFILLKKPGMPGKLLIYNVEFGCFTWGQYKFTNLTPESSNLERLLSIVNG